MLVQPIVDQSAGDDDAEDAGEDEREEGRTGTMTDEDEHEHEQLLEEGMVVVAMIA